MSAVVSFTIPDLYDLSQIDISDVLTGVLQSIIGFIDNTILLSEIQETQLQLYLNISIPILSLLFSVISLLLYLSLRNIQKKNTENAKTVFWGNLLMANIKNIIDSNKTIIDNPELLRVYGINHKTFRKYMNMRIPFFIHMTNRTFGSMMYYMPTPVKDLHTYGFSRNSIMTIACTRPEMRRAWPFMRRFFGPQIIEHYYTPYLAFRNEPPLREDTSFSTFINRVDYEIYTNSLLSLPETIYSEKTRVLKINYHSKYGNTIFEEINDFKNEIWIHTVKSWISDGENSKQVKIDSIRDEIVFHYLYRGRNKFSTDYDSYSQYSRIRTVGDYVKYMIDKPNHTFLSFKDRIRKSSLFIRRVINLPNSPLGLSPLPISHRLFIINENNINQGIVIFVDFHSNRHYEPVVNLILKSKDTLDQLDRMETNDIIKFMRELNIDNIEEKSTNSVENILCLIWKICFYVYQLPWVYLYLNSMQRFIFVKNNIDLFATIDDSDVWSNSWHLNETNREYSYGFTDKIERYISDKK